MARQILIAKGIIALFFSNLSNLISFKSADIGRKPTRSPRRHRGAGSTEFAYALLGISVAVVVAYTGLGSSVRDLVSTRTQEVAGKSGSVDPIGDTGNGAVGGGNENTDGNGFFDGGSNGPADPGTGDPVDPGTGDPVDPGTGDPVDPGTGDPVDPGTGDPGTGVIDPGVVAEKELQCETSWDDPKYGKGEGSWLNPANWKGKIESGVAVVKDFVSGLLAGLGDQAKELWELIKDPSVLWDLGKAFIEDPRGTLQQILDDLITDARTLLECGPMDVGRIIGQNVNPVAALKVVARIAGSARLTRIVNNVPDNFGCASFTKGTLISTPSGLVEIETLKVGDIVYSRDEKTHELTEQAITRLLRRTADSYYRLTSWNERIEVTEEHPFWVQGKGWVRAADLEKEDPLVTIDGDELFLSNRIINEATPVYNFSVGNTPSYFAGKSQFWVHNANRECSLRDRPNVDPDFDPDADLIRGPRGGEYRLAGRDPDGTRVYQDANDGAFYRLDADGKPQRDRTDAQRVADNNRVGLSGERAVTADLESKGWTRVSEAHPDNIDGYQGRNGIDGVYMNENGDFLVVESKSSAASAADSRLGNSGDGTQLSDTWTENRIEDPSRGGILDDDNGSIMDAYREAQANDSVTSVKAEVSGTRVGSASGGANHDIVYREVSSNGGGSATVGDVFDVGSGGGG